MLGTLRSRIVALFSVLLIATMTVVLGIVGHESLRISAQHNLNELAVAERVFHRVSAHNQIRMHEAASVLAADFGFRDAVSSNDHATIVSALSNHGARIHADAMFLLDLEGAIHADTLHPRAVGQPAPFLPFLHEAETEGWSGGFTMIEGRPYQLTVVPVMAPDVIAWIAIGLRIDATFTDDLAALTAVEVSFLRRHSDGTWTSLASTQAPAERNALLSSMTTRSDGASRLRASSLQVGDFDTRLLPITEADGTVLAVALQRSLGSAYAIFQPLLRTLGIIAVVMLTLALLGSFVIAGRIVGPLSRLAAIARRIRDGDYSGPIDIDTDGEIGAFAATFEHMRDSISTRELEIRRLAFEDALTGLPNRAMITARLNTMSEVGQRIGQGFAVLLLNLDRFREVNETLGHEAGDQILITVGQRLRAVVKSTEYVSRFGGDEFALILGTSKIVDLERVVDRIHDALGQPLFAAGQEIDVSASIGVTTFPEHGVEASTLLRRCDIAMYKSKRTRSKLTLYETPQDDHREERLHLLGDLRRAIQDNELQLMYQPKIELASGRVHGVEALVRWAHPSRGLVPPLDFLPFAEQTGAIIAITRWVITEATRQAAAWMKAGLVLRMSLNISARDLVDHALVDHINRALLACSMPASMLCLEITESALMEDATTARTVLQRLSALGVALSIDDYGTGYSSLAYIKDLPVDELKIDRAFVKDMESNSQDVAIVRSTIDLGHTLNLAVVAEGVETAGQLQLLGSLGCDYAQGYYISRPLAGTMFVPWLNGFSQSNGKQGSGAADAVDPLLRRA